jgi:hypothetical protein
MRCKKKEGSFASLRMTALTGWPVSDPIGCARGEMREVKGLVRCGRLLGERKNVDDATMLATIGELDDAIDACEKRIVLGAADVLAGLIARATLANQNAAASDDLAAEALDAEPLSVRIASVYG